MSQAYITDFNSADEPHELADTLTSCNNAIICLISPNLELQDYDRDNICTLMRVLDDLQQINLQRLRETA